MYLHSSHDYVSTALNLAILSFANHKFDLAFIEFLIFTHVLIIATIGLHGLLTLKTAKEKLGYSV